MTTVFMNRSTDIPVKPRRLFFALFFLTLGSTSFGTAFAQQLEWQSASAAGALPATTATDGVLALSAAAGQCIAGAGMTDGITQHQAGFFAFAGAGTLGAAPNPASPPPPKQFSLSQNYPNPFNPETAIRYQLKASSDVSLKVFDVLGREAVRLVSGRQAAGNYTVRFNAAALSSGVYFYRLAASGAAGGFVETKKMYLLK